MNTQESFEDRFGSPEFQDRKGSNVENSVSQKEKVQMKKYGIKPKDTMIDKINKVIAEEMPAQDAEIDNNEYDEEEDEAKQKEKEQKNELKIKIMQYLNPRIVKSKELKNYVDRSNIKEEIYKTLNSFAQQKLNAYKNAIALNLPVELGESDKFMPTPRQVPAPPGGLPVPKGYERVKSWGGAYELRRTAESLRDEHNELHTTPSEETEQLDEAKRNPNVMRQGRTKVIKARVRGGKVQRRKKVSAVKGYTIRGGKLKRMSAAERLRRKRGARIGKIKRKAKMSRAIMKRKRSLRKRASLGLKE
jgi:hypothetical protein